MSELLVRILLSFTIAFVLAFTVMCIIVKIKPVGKHISKIKKDKIGVMDTILVIEAIAIVLYIAVDFIVFWHIGAEPSSLTIGFFSVCGGENGFMAWIKTRKEEERFRRYQKEDSGKPEEYIEDKSL